MRIHFISFARQAAALRRTVLLACACTAARALTLCAVSVLWQQLLQRCGGRGPSIESPPVLPRGVEIPQPDHYCKWRAEVSHRCLALAFYQGVL